MQPESTTRRTKAHEQRTPRSGFAVLAARIAFCGLFAGVAAFGAEHRLPAQAPPNPNPPQAQPAGQLPASSGSNASGPHPAAKSPSGHSGANAVPASRSTGRTQAHRGARGKPSPAIPEPAPAPPAPVLPPPPNWPINDKPTAATVVWDSQGLRIDADNSSLQQILKDVATDTGAKVSGLNADQRVFGAYGPGPARQVLSELLDGTGYNVLMFGDQGSGTPREIVLSAPPNSPAAANGNRTNLANQEEEYEPPEPQPEPEPEPTQNFQPPQAPPLPMPPRTPQQYYQELQQRQQQLQQQQQQQNQNQSNPQ